MVVGTIDRAEYDGVIAELLPQITMGCTYDDFFVLIYERLRGLVPFNRIGVAVLRGGAERLEIVSCRSDGPLELRVGYAADVSNSTLAEVLRSGTPRILNDLVAYARAKPESESTRLMLAEGMRSSLTLPLVMDGRPVGAVFFSSRREGAYTEEHICLLQRLASHIAVSFEKARLTDALRSQNRQLLEARELQEHFLEKLQDEVRRQTDELRNSEKRYRLQARIGQIVNSSLDIEQVFRHAAEEVHKLTRCGRVSLLMFDSANKIRRGFALEFDGMARAVEIPAAVLGSVLGECVWREQGVRIARCLETARDFPEARQLADQGYRASACLPLCHGARSLGVLGLATRKAADVDSWDLALLAAVGTLLATGLANAAAYSQISALKSQLEAENVYLRDEIRTEHDFANIVGDGAAMLQLRRAIEQVAATDSTVLICGETGTGKELVARAIHGLSRRREHILVKVNCAALSAGVVTSELFGHERGAYTGADRQRVGRFELANGGTIFLDEIAEIPRDNQVLLLRVLQERVFERVGGNEPIDVDVRVIVATNRDLEAAVERGEFRADLFYRLNVFPIRVPPLRERREDIPALMNHFISRFSPGMSREITRVNRKTMELLMGYHWPGNVREFENIVERSMIVARGDSLEVDPHWLSGTDSAGGCPEQAPLADIERQAIAAALHRSGGKIYGAGGAAHALGLKPTTLYGKMRKYRIRWKSG